MLNNVKIKKQMLNIVKIFYDFVCEYEANWTGKVTVISTKLYKIKQYPFHHNQ